MFQEFTKKQNIADLLLYKNVIGSVFIKGFAIIISFLTTKAYISYFENAEVLGVWFTLLTILQWILTFDFGIGNGLRNKLVPIIQQKDYKRIKEYVSSAYISISILSLGICFIFCVVINIIDWNTALNVKTNILSKNALTLTILVTFCGIVFQFILKIVTSILHALQQNILANATMLFSNILLWIYLLLFRFDGVEIKLIALAAMYAVTVISPFAIVSIYVFRNKIPGCGPSVRFFRIQYAKEVVSLGGAFFLIQLELLLLTATDSWFISYLYDASSVVDFQIYYKLFSLPTTMFALISQPLWSAIAVAIEKRDYKWIEKKEKQVNKWGVLVSIICILMVFLSKPIISVWVGTENCTVSYYTAFAFAVLSIEQIFMYSSTSIANGMSKLMCQNICNGVALIIKFTLTFIVARYSDTWANIIWVEVIGSSLIVFSQPIVNKMNIKRMKMMEE